MRAPSTTLAALILAIGCSTTAPSPDTGARDAGLSRPADANAKPDLQQDTASADTSGGATAPADTSIPLPDTSPAPLKLDGPAFAPDKLATWGIPADATYAHCTAVADFDGDGDRDFALVPTAFVLGQGWKARVDVHLLEGGKLAKVRSSPIDTTLLIPNAGCAVADPDDDGVPDLLLGGTGTMAWLRNDGSGVFTDRSSELVPDDFTQDPWTFAPGDFNGDGRPDLVIGAGLVYGACSDVSCGWGKTDFFCGHPPPAPAKSWGELVVLWDQLWLGVDLPAGVSVAMSDSSGLLNVLPDGELSQIVPADLDGDGHVDLIVGHDFGAHAVLRNTGKGGFAAVSGGMRAEGHTMGWAVADFDGDGRPDLVMADLGPNALYLAGPPAADAPGGLTWTDAGAAWGLHDATRDLSVWTPLAEDFDHDGRVDLFLGTSAVAEPGKLNTFVECVGAQAPAAQQYDLYLRNEGDHFSVWKVPAPQTKLGIERVAQTTIDIDADGDLDVLQVRYDGQVRVLLNQLPLQGPAVTFEVRGPKGNRMAVGARITGRVAGRPFSRQVLGTTGFGGAAVTRLHVPAPGGAALMDVQVHWPAPLHLTRKLGILSSDVPLRVVTPY